MCALAHLAHPVTVDANRHDPPADDPITRLFIDHTTPSGIRLLAVAEPVFRTMHGYLTAAAALAAFEEALVVAVNWGIEPGMMRAFAAANEAVRAANQLTVVHRRTFVGITAAAIDGQAAVIGIVPPGQALLVQDRRLYGIPDLRSWSPSFMPAGAGDGQDPLGLRATVVPTFRRTTVREGDGLLLGASAVGRVLAEREYVPLADAPETAVVDQLEAALEAANVDDAYAAWIPFNADPAAARRRSERQVEIERLWKSGATQPFVPMPAHETERGEPRATGLHRVHTRLIAASERVLGGREPHAPEGPAVRELPAGTNLRHLRATRRNKPAPSYYAWLPRGLRPALSRRGVIALLLVVAVAASAFFGRGVRFASAEKPDRFLGNARAELTLAEGAPSDALKRAHLIAAEQSLNDAVNHGAKPETIVSLENELAAAKDALDGIERLSNVVELAALPAAAAGSAPRVLLANGALYLIAGSVYRIDPSGGGPEPVLTPGREYDGVTLGTIVNATVDGGALLVSDGTTLFRMKDDGDWTAVSLPDDVSDGWSGRAAGAFKGNYYLLEPTQTQIVKFAGANLDGDPTDWIEQPEPALANAIDMEIDGHIYVLLADGTILDYFKGEKQGGVTLAGDGHVGSFIGLAPSATAGELYVIESEQGVATLIRVVVKSGSTQEIAALTSWHAGYDPAATQAFGQTVDFAVDDASHTLYFVTGGALWKATLPVS